MPLKRYCPNELCKEESKYLIKPVELTRFYVRPMSQEKIEYETKYQYLKMNDFRRHLYEVQLNILENKTGPTKTWTKSIKTVKRTRHKQSFKSIGWFCYCCKNLYLDEETLKKYPGPEEWQKVTN